MPHIVETIPVALIEQIDKEPRIRDIDLAERLGFKAARQIRELIQRNSDELETYGSLSYRATNSGSLGGRPGKSYYLNEGQALTLCALSKTPKAAVIRKALISVFIAWREGKIIDIRPHYRMPTGLPKPIDCHMKSTDMKTATLTITLKVREAMTLMAALYGERLDG